MAEGVLGLGSSGSTGLNQELIDKLKAAETTAKIDPITADLETWDKELEKIDEIDVKTKELLDSIKDFDLFTSGTNAFDQVIANTTGTSAVFDAIDVSSLTEGTNTVTITQLAQRDVYQTATFSDKDAQVLNGDDTDDKLSITVAGTTYDFTTNGTTYQELADEINKNPELTSSIEQVGDNDFRLVIKSTLTGEENKLAIEQTGINLGINSQVTSKVYENTAVQIEGGADSGDKITINGIDFSTEDESLKTLRDNINTDGTYDASVVDGKLIIKSKDGSDLDITQTGVDLGFSSAILSAQNMNANVDGVDYDVSSNQITIQGNLTVTAVELGTSTISLQKDTSSILPALKDFVDKYNELVTLVDDELYSDDPSIQDTSSIRMMMDSIKSTLFDSYGFEDDKSVFNYGFSVDSSGMLSIDDAVFSQSLVEDPDGLKTLFVGVAEDEGLATVLKSYLDDLDSYDGLLTTYSDNMVNRKTKLEEDKEKEQASIDSKYSLMAQQFASYTAIITEMENSFAGMKSMMDDGES